MKEPQKNDVSQQNQPQGFCGTDMVQNYRVGMFATLAAALIGAIAWFYLA